jgi:hypothetical protein
MKNIKNKTNILKKHKYKSNNKNNNACDISNNDISFSNDNNNINYNNAINEYEYECLICLEVKNTNNETTMKLKELEICEKNCDCNGCFHKSCLNSWFIIKFACPICRTKISNFNPYQIKKPVYFYHTQRRITKNGILFIIFSMMFVYWFYF